MTATLPKNETSNALRITGSVLLGLASFVTFALGAFYFSVIYFMQDATSGCSRTSTSRTRGRWATR